MTLYSTNILSIAMIVMTRLCDLYIVTKIVRWVYGESNPTSWIMENDALFHEYSIYCNDCHDTTLELYIVTKIVGESNPTSWIMENDALFHEYSIYCNDCHDTTL
ncbi:hypothetical protein AVEN_267506-1 [Araneus ventricosus]|uniref:Uncharacterized protein n=1 Tax=Araneus ventricosus TaxID=182803 RepID=A0A4Y2IQI4_ARAVE|nr:hypothetical protein AVEN_267506-1 [Araneus ventricosus]